jgi:hypothetical protein
MYNFHETRKRDKTITASVFSVGGDVRENGEPHCGDSSLREVTDYRLGDRDSILDRSRDLFATMPRWLCGPTRFLSNRQAGGRLNGPSVKCAEFRSPCTFILTFWHGA